MIGYNELKSKTTCELCKTNYQTKPHKNKSNCSCIITNNGKLVLNIDSKFMGKIIFGLKLKDKELINRLTDSDNEKQVCDKCIDNLFSRGKIISAINLNNRCVCCHDTCKRIDDLASIYIINFRVKKYSKNLFDVANIEIDRLDYYKNYYNLFKHTALGNDINDNMDYEVGNIYHHLDTIARVEVDIDANGKLIDASNVVDGNVINSNMIDSGVIDSRISDKLNISVNDKLNIGVNDKLNISATDKSDFIIDNLHVNMGSNILNEIENNKQHIIERCNKLFGANPLLWICSKCYNQSLLSNNRLSLPALPNNFTFPFLPKLYNNILDCTYLHNCEIDIVISYCSNICSCINHGPKNNKDKIYSENTNASNSEKRIIDRFLKYTKKILFKYTRKKTENNKIPIDINFIKLFMRLFDLQCNKDRYYFCFAYPDRDNHDLVEKITIIILAYINSSRDIPALGFQSLAYYFDLGSWARFQV